MKKTLIIFALIFIGHLSIAQSVGVYSSYLAPSKKYSKPLPSPKSSYTIGLETVFNINTKFKLKTGIEYVSSKYASSYSLIDYLGNKKGIVSYENTLNYIGIPIGLRYEFKGQKINPFLGSDIKPSLLIGSVYKNNYTKNKLNTLGSNKLLVNASIVGGFKFNTTKKTYITTSAAYNFQVNDTYKSYSGVKFDGVSFSVSFGIKLK